MAKLYSIDDLLFGFVGHTDAIGDESYDYESLRNLDTINDIMEWCIEQLEENIEKIYDIKSSVNEIARESYHILNTKYYYMDGIIEEKKKKDKERKTSNEV